jgi:hypothetical protein
VVDIYVAVALIEAVATGTSILGIKWAYTPKNGHMWLEVGIDHFEMGIVGLEMGIHASEMGIVAFEMGI